MARSTASPLGGAGARRTFLRGARRTTGVSCANASGAWRRMNSISFSVVSTSLKERRAWPHAPCCSACVNSCTSTAFARSIASSSMPPDGVENRARARR
jgi:hypothetical protein